MTPNTAVAKIEPAQVRQVQELKHSSPLIAARIDPTGRFVVCSAQDSTLQRWELANGQRVQLDGHQSWVRALTFVGGSLISGDYAGRVLFWHITEATPKPYRTIEAHKGWVRAVAVSPDGTTLATCGNDLLVKLWSMSDGKLLRELSGHTCHVYNLAFHPSGSHLVSADLKGTLKHWDLSKGTAVRELDAKLLHSYDPTFRADHGGARALKFDASGQLLACAGITEVTNAFAGIGKPLVILFDWTTGQRKQLLKPKEAFQGTAWGVAFHPAGYVIGAAGGNGGAIYFWKPEQSADLFMLKLPNNARDLDLHPDGKRLAVPFFDGALRVYDASPKTA
jgi:WD40 repeat protein